MGGSGVYELLDNSKEVFVKTPYGKPSDKIELGEIADKKVAFLPRHGRGHRIPPHLVNYRANVFAMHKLGVRKLIGPGAVGSLKKSIRPGHFVITDQFIDRTNGRKDTFVEGPKVDHLPAAEVYCDNLRDIAVKRCRALKIPVHTKGTVVIINGPRFSSKAESLWYKKMGWHILSMTQYPENVLARELGMCYLSIGLVTDYDAGLEGEPGIQPVTFAEVMKTVEKNARTFRKLVFQIVKNLPKTDGKKSCICVVS